jgi:hypothetical protein
MAPCDYHELYPSIDFESIPRYLNKFDIKWKRDFPEFNNDPCSDISHDVKL